MKKAYSFARRGPDRVTEELTAVLSGKDWFEFKALFLVVHANLRARNAVGGGEEMLRLRAYERLQNLVQDGAVEKDGKRYRGVPAALALLIEQMNAATAAMPPRPVVEVAAPKKPVKRTRSAAAAA